MLRFNAAAGALLPGLNVAVVNLYGTKDGRRAFFSTAEKTCSAAGMVP